MNEAVYYDGVTGRRRAVSIAFAAEDLVATEADQVVARWRYRDLRRQAGPPMPLRLRSEGAAELARIEIGDRRLANEVACRSPDLDSATDNRKALTKIVGWSMAVAVSLALTATLLVPMAADRLAPLVPVWAEKRLGDLAERQVATFLGKGACTGPDGVAALDSLAAKLTASGEPRIEIRAAVLDSPLPNAVALPGGRIYLFRGLLDLATDPDEIAGVLAHEIGHVARRDALRKLMQQGGNSFLLGLLFGDVGGAGLGLWIARLVLDSSYSRDVESAADAFAAGSMTTLGRPAVPMGELLGRIAKDDGENPLGFMRSHPISRDRLAAMERLSVPAFGRPLLDHDEWIALKNICKVATGTQPRVE